MVEIPFFDDLAEFYFENYLHSIITQKFNVPLLDLENIKFHEFSLASIAMRLKEMEQTTVLEELERTFFMTLGRFEALPIANLDAGEHKLLPLSNSIFITNKGLLDFSFLSSTLPTELIVNNGIIETQIALPSQTVTDKLHSVTVPVSTIFNGDSTALNLSLKFTDNTILVLGEFHIVDEGLDHNIIVFQNNYGTVSTIELTGELKTDQQYQANIFINSNENRRSLNATEIQTNESYAINTGYWLDENKYTVLSNVLKSFNIYLLQANSLKEIVLNGNQKLMPYKTNYYQNNETLKFKISKNDDSIYGAF